MDRSALLSGWKAKLQEQATPRALIGLAALVVIIAIWALSELSASVSGLRNNVEELERARRLELSLLNDQAWLDNAGDLQIRLNETQEGFWTGATSGIVAAQLQGAVERAARNAELIRPRINVSSSPDQLGNEAVLFEVSVTAQDRNGQFLAFLQELGAVEGLIVVSRFNWRRSNGSLDIRLQAPAFVGDAEVEA